MTKAVNNFGGGTASATVTTGNSGGTSGDAFDNVVIGTGAYLDYDDDPVHLGPLSARFHTDSTAAQSYVEYDSSTLGSLSTVYGRFYLYIGTAPSNAFNLVRLRDASNDTLASIELGTDLKLRNREGQAGGYSTIATAPSALPTAQWVRVDFKFVIDATHGHIHTKVYGTPDALAFDYDLTDSYNQNTGSGPATKYQLGVCNNVAESGWIRLDEIEWNDYDYPGPLDSATPSVPTDLNAVANGTTAVDLSWAASSDDLAVTGYNVYRDSVFVDDVATTSFQDTGLTAGNTYVYTVSAFDAASNESAQSASAPVTLPVVDTTAPSTPSGLTATAVSSDQIDLAWTGSTDNVAVDHYNVYRDVYTNPPVAQVPAGTTSYSDLGLAAATTHNYKVSAVDAVGNESAQSTSAGATTEAAPPTGAFEVMHGFYQGDGNSLTLATTEAGLGKDFAAFRAYASGLGLPSQSMIDAANEGRLMVFSSNNKNSSSDWADIANGDEDAYFINLGRSLQHDIDGDEVVYIWFHEPHDNVDEAGYPGGTKGGTAMGADYVAVWQRIHDLWRSQGQSEDGHSWLRHDGEGGKIVLGYCAVLSWALDGTSGGSSYVQGADNLWPGGAIIDVLCHDDYNTISVSGGGDRLFGIPTSYTTPPSGLSDRSWRACMEMCDDLAKPLIIGEWGSVPVNGIGGLSTSDCDAAAFDQDLKDALDDLGFSMDRDGWFEQAADFIKNDDLAEKWFAGFLYYHSRRWMFTTQNGQSDHPSGCVYDTSGSGVEGRDGWVAGFVNDSTFVGTPVPLFDAAGQAQFPRNVGGSNPPPSGSGGVEFVASAFTSVNKGSSGITIDKPAGTLEGHVLTAHIQGDYALLDHSQSGWTLVGYREEPSGQGDQDDNDPPKTGGKDLVAYVFVKVAGASEPSSYTFTQDGSSTATLWAGAVIAWSGVDTTSPIGDVAWDGSDPAGTITCPAVDVEADGVFVCHWVHDDPARFNIPSGMTKVDYLNTDPNTRVEYDVFFLPKDTSKSKDDSGAIAWKKVPSARTTSAKTVTIISGEGGGHNDCGYTIALRPA